MKNLCTLAMGISLMLFSFCVTAQTNPDLINQPDRNKPKLFQELPEKIVVDLPALTGLLNRPVGATISVNLAKEGNFMLEGQVVSSATKYENTIQSVVIRSSNFNGAKLTFSRGINADRSQAFTGRIMSLQHGDLYELKFADKQYFLLKRKLHDLVNE